MISKQPLRILRMLLQPRRLAYGMLIIPLLLLVACGTTSGNSSASIVPTPTMQPDPTTQPSESVDADLSSLPNITITGTDYSFAMPESVPAGFVAITFVNAGSLPHQVILSRLNDGVTPDKLLATAKTGSIPGVLGAIELAGGPNAIAPKTDKQQVILNLSPGQYAAICALPGPDGMPHFQMGMIKMFTVAPTSNSVLKQNFTASSTIKLVNFGYVMPATLKYHSIVEVANQGTQPHELTILKPVAGKTVQDVLADVTTHGDAGLRAFALSDGGMAPIAPGMTNWIVENLPPGQYVAACFVPDQATRKAHVMLGMAYIFTVQA